MMFMGRILEIRFKLHLIKVFDILI